jgi:isopenicillin-N N-acyltransferase-like protein
MAALFRLMVALIVGATLAPLVWAQPPATPSETFRYEEGKYGDGELKYHGRIPVLVVQGTPEEMGKQIGHLQIGVIAEYQKLLERYVKFRGWQDVYPWLLRAGGLLEANFPASHRAEFAAAAREVPVDRNLLVLINTAFDVVSMFACSALVAEPARSNSGELLFGRNLDLPPFANLHELTMVTVYRGKGKRAFASIGFPGVFGLISGMNDAGLALAVNEITETKDDATKFNPLGTPKLLLLRRVLEECATIDEAEKLLRQAPRTGLMAVTLCDKERGVVFEVTPKNVIRRPAREGLCFCTNQFRTPELCVLDRCYRWDRLELSRRQEKLTMDDVGDYLHAARFPQMTMQTMIFEPARLRLHLAFGQIPSSALPRQTLELEPLLRPTP